MIHAEFNDLVNLKSKAQILRLLKNNQHATLAGNYVTKIRGQGLEFDSVRQYVLGDDVRNIDWRVTARSGKTHLKIFCEERDQEILIAIDLGSNMNFASQGKFKSYIAAEITALLAWAANINNDRVGLISFGEGIKSKFIKASHNKNNIYNVFREVCNPTKSEDSNNYLYQLAFHKGSHSRIFIISDFMNLNDQYYDLLKRLKRRHEVNLCFIYDKSDYDLAQIGEIHLQDSKGEIFVVDTNDSRAQKKYREDWQNNYDKLDNFCLANKIKKIDFPTSENIIDNLIKAFI